MVNKKVISSSVKEKSTRLVGNSKRFISKKLENSQEISQEALLKTLDWAYSKTIEGIPGQQTLDEFVEDYLSKSSDKDEAIDKIIKFQTTKAAVSGFVTGFGGVLTLPVTVPANITTVILFQMRMIAAIASIRGYNLRSDQVQTFVYATLAGSSVADIVKKSGITIGNKLAVNTVRRIPGTVLTKINQAVGFRLVTKFGTKGVVNLGKMVPIAGAGIGAIFDVTTTRTIARMAKKTFTTKGIELGNDEMISKEMVNN